MTFFISNIFTFKNIYLKIISIILLVIFLIFIYKYRKFKSINICWWCGINNKQVKLKNFKYEYNKTIIEMKICSKNCKENLIKAWYYAKKTHYLALSSMLIFYIYPFIYYFFLIKSKSNLIWIKGISIFLVLLGVYPILFPMSFTPYLVSRVSLIGGLKYYIILFRTLGIIFMTGGLILIVVGGG